MKSIFKLTKGELIKIFKGIGVYIMTGILVVAISLFAVLYETHVEGTGMLETLFNRVQTITVFDIMDGEADDIVGDGFTSAIEIPGASELLTDDGKFNDYFKMILLTNSLDELILNMMATPTSGGEGGGGSALSTTLDMPSPEDYLSNEMFALLKTASMLGSTFQGDLARAQDVRGRIHSEVDFFVNGDAFGKTYIDYISGLFIDFARQWDEFSALKDTIKQKQAYKDAYDDFVAKKTSSDLNERVASYIALLNQLEPLITASKGIMETFTKIGDYTELSFVNTKYLLYKTSGMFGMDEAGQRLTMQLEKFTQKSANYANLLTGYDTMASDVQILKDALPMVFNNPFFPNAALEYCIMKDITRAASVEPATMDLERFMAEVDALVLDLTFDGQFFGGFNPVGIDAPKRDEFDTLTEYYAAVMQAPIDCLKKSLGAPITEEVYSEHIKPYLTVLDECDELFVAINATAAEYRALSSEEKKEQASVLYARLRRDYQVFMSKINTFNTLLQSLNLSNTVETLKYKDDQLKSIYGNQLFGSKYSIRSSVTECKYFLSSGEVNIDYTSASTLDAGYGYMNFAWVIAYILILIFGIVIGAGQIAGEHSQGTMKLLLIRPHKRWQVLLSKLIATMIVVLAFLVVALTLTFLIGGIFWGFNGTTALLVFNSVTPFMIEPFGVMALSYAFAFVEIFIYVLIALMVSTVFKSHAGAVSVSMLIYFLAMILTTLLGQYNWYKYIVFNNSNLFAYFSSGPRLNDMTFWFSFVVNIVYIGLLMFASLFTFQKRDAV